MSHQSNDALYEFVDSLSEKGLIEIIDYAEDKLEELMKGKQ